MICFSACGFCMLEYLFFGKKIVILSYFLCFFQGFVSLPIMSVAFDFGVEITYPIGESFSTGLLMDAGQVFGIIYTVVCSYLLDHYESIGQKEKGSNYCFLLLFIACAIGAFFSLFVKSDLRRFNKDNIRSSSVHLRGSQIVKEHSSRAGSIADLSASQREAIMANHK